MHYLATVLDPRDAFVVALRNAFKRAGLPLADLPRGQSPEGDTVIRLEMQVDGLTALATVPLGDRRHEFLEENPDMLQVAVGDLLVRHRRQAGS